MRSRSLAFALAAGLGLAALSGSLPVQAQASPATRAAADALFEDGRRFMSENKYAEACPKLEESQRVDPGVGTLYNLSVCYEAIGRTASAWVGFREVAQMALTAGQADREKAARGKASALEPKLMRLKITVQGANAGIEVKRDGAVVSPALWGTAVPLDPGKHRVSASAPGKEPWEITVQLDQPGGMVNVEVPPLLDHKAGAPPPLPPPGDTKPPPGRHRRPGVPPPPLAGEERPAPLVDDAGGHHGHRGGRRRPGRRRRAGRHGQVGLQRLQHRQPAELRQQQQVQRGRPQPAE